MSTLNKKPFFSVVIPLYNKEDFIEDSIKSVLNQTYNDFEIIIINDGSTDNSLSLVNSIKDDRIQVINKENTGLSATRNTGIKLAHANYIAFLDADDLWMDDFLQTIFNLIKINTSIKIFATKAKILTQKKGIVFDAKIFNKRNQKILTRFFELTKFHVNASSLVIDKNVFNKVGYFNESVNYAEDEEFLIRCKTDFDFVYYKEPKMYYRLGFDMQMTSPNSKFKRVIPDFSEYLNDENKLGLKPYLDFIHYKLVVLFKMERNHDLVRLYKEKISIKNLTFIQQIKYHTPIWAFYYSKSIYIWFSRIFIHF